MRVVGQHAPYATIFTANEHPRMPKYGYASGAVDYLFKPTSIHRSPKVCCWNTAALSNGAMTSWRWFLPSVLDNAAEGFWWWATVIRFANPAISRLLNAPVTELEGKELRLPAETAHSRGPIPSFMPATNAGETLRLHRRFITHRAGSAGAGGTFMCCAPER